MTAANARISSDHGTITVSDANGESVSIYTLSGQKVAVATAAQNETFSVPTGVYVAKVGGKTVKVNVK